MENIRPNIMRIIFLTVRDLIIEKVLKLKSI